MMKSINTYKFTISLIAIIIVVLSFPVLVDIISPIDQFKYLKLITFAFVTHVFTSKDVMWNYIGILITAIAIVTPFVYQIELKIFELKAQKLNLLRSLITELNSNMRIVSMGGFEVKFQMSVFDSISLKAHFIANQFTFKKISRLYSYMAYFERIAQQNPSNQILLSEKLTWLFINFVSLFNSIKKKELAEHRIYNEVNGFKLSNNDEFSYKIDVLKKYLIESPSHCSWFDQVVSDVNKAGREIVFERAKDVIYSYLRSSMSKKYSLSLQKNIKNKILKMFA